MIPLPTDTLADTLFRCHHNKPTIHTTCSFFIIKLAHPNRKSWKKELVFKMLAPKLDDEVHEQAWAEATAVWISVQMRHLYCCTISLMNQAFVQSLSLL
jgi:hypothetical protein